MKRAAHTTLVAGLFLASHGAFGKSLGTNTTSVLGVDRLALSETPGTNSTVCYSGVLGMSGASVPDTMAVTLGASSNVTINFLVNDIVPASGSEPMLMFLIYGTDKKTTPQLTSKNTSYPFLLGNGLQIIAEYRIAPFSTITPATVSIGQVSGSPSASFTFQVQLDSSKIKNLISSNAGTLYFQAGLIPEADLAISDFSRAIFSEVDTVMFAQSCPSSSSTQVTANSSGGKSASSNTSSSGESGKSSTSTSGTSGSQTTSKPSPSGK